MSDMGRLCACGSAGCPTCPLVGDRHGPSNSDDVAHETRAETPSACPTNPRCSCLSMPVSRCDGCAGALLCSPRGCRAAQVLDGCGWWYAIMLAQSHPIIRPLVAVVPRAGSVFSTLFCLDFLIFKFTRLCAVRFGPNFSDFLGVCVSFSFLYFFSFLGWVFCVSRRFGQ